MDDDVRRKQNEIIIGIYTTPVEDLLISCCEGLREIIPFDHSYTALNDQSDRFKAAFNYQSMDTDEETTALYADYYHTIDYLSWFYNQGIPATVRSTDLVPPEVIEQSRILSISKNTLKHHVASIYRKMHVSNGMQFFAAFNRALKNNDNSKSDSDIT